jgi:acyl carrier protein
MSEDIKAVLREYVAGSPILRRPGPVSDSTPLATYGILDSMAMLDLVLFLEARFGIEFSARDLDRRRIETIDHIESLVREKIAQKKASQGGPRT